MYPNFDNVLSPSSKFNSKIFCASRKCSVVSCLFSFVNLRVLMLQGSGGGGESFARLWCGKLQRNALFSQRAALAKMCRGSLTVGLAFVSDNNREKHLIIHIRRGVWGKKKKGSFRFNETKTCRYTTYRFVTTYAYRSLSWVTQRNWTETQATPKKIIVFNRDWKRNITSDFGLYHVHNNHLTDILWFNQSQFLPKRHNKN